MGLKEYNRKRDFSVTSEPRGQASKQPASSNRLAFVIQKHDASRLHYDFRLEMEGVLRSWAVPKGPSLDPKDRRLAVHVEDHPLEYGMFEGIIPEGEYGGGTVLLWDAGEWIPKGDPVADYQKGSLKFELKGEKLHGGWMLVRMPGEEGKNWLLIKERDKAARAADDYSVTEKKPKSVTTRRSLERIASDADRTWTSSGERKSAKTSRAKPAASKKKAVAAPKAKKATVARRKKA